MRILVTLDGVDGTGKSTIGHLLANTGRYGYYKTPSGPFAEMRSEVDKHATAMERYCFYRVATEYDSCQIKERIKMTSVACDRYIASTLAYHLAMDKRVIDIYSSGDLVVPNFAFLLLATPAERKQRLAMRAVMASDAAIEQDSVLLDRVQDIFLELNPANLLPFKLIPIDTDGKTPQEVLAMIEMRIAQGSTNGT